MTVPTFRTNLQDVTALLQERPLPIAVDLADLAASAYNLDRRTRRGAAWERRLSLLASVANPAAWNSLKTEIADVLQTMTDDAWDVTFGSVRSPVPEECLGWLFKMPRNRVTSVGLFSGGLDSFAGAAVWLEEHPGEVLGLLSVCTSKVVGRVQRDLADMLAAAYPDRVVHLRAPLNLVGTPQAERSQRTRGFVHTAFATAVASQAGVTDILIFENGFGAINPRIAEHQDGAQATRSTHPHMLHRLQDFYRSAGFDVRTQLPFENYTKAELIARIPVRLRDGIRLTVSCDSYPLRRWDAKQCGTCSSCVLRLQALNCSELQEYERTDYVVNPFDDGELSNHFWLMAHQARQIFDIESSGSLNDAVRKWPQIALGESSLASPVVGRRWQIMQRYGHEWRRLVERNPRLGARLGWSVNE